MTRAYRPVYLDEVLGELGRLPNGAIINIGGTDSPTFTVGGRPLLFADGSSTAPDTGTGTTLQAAYSNSFNPAQINTTAGKNLIFNSNNDKKFTFNANTGAVTIEGGLEVVGLFNGVPVENLIDHLNSLTAPPKHTAAQVSFDDTGLVNVSGGTVQAALESIDSQLTSFNAANVVGFEYVQVAPSTTWVIVHAGGSRKVQATIWDETDSALLPDTIKITDDNTVTVTFSSPQAGKAILMLF
jgi:hypothetical protein